MVVKCRAGHAGSVLLKGKVLETILVPPVELSAQDARCAGGENYRSVNVSEERNRRIQFF